jgi:hypothetical protein
MMLIKLFDEKNLSEKGERSFGIQKEIINFSLWT